MFATYSLPPSTPHADIIYHALLQLHPLPVRIKAASESFLLSSNGKPENFISKILNVSRLEVWKILN